MGWISALLALLGMGAQFANQPEGVNTHDLPAQSYDPLSDPLLSALSMNAMTGVGSFDPTVLMNALPLQQLYAGVSAGGMLDRRGFKYMQESGSRLLSEEDLANYRRAQSLVGTINPDTITEKKPEGRKYSNAEIFALTGYTGQNRKSMDRLETTAINEGYDSLEDLAAQERAGRARVDETGARVGPIADQVREGILASQGRLGQYLQDLPNLLTGEANPFKTQLREQALAQAQKYGANPYGFLETADATALNRALQLIGGEQSVVQAQQSAAQPIAALRSQNQISAGQIGAAQAQALAQILQGNAATQNAYGQNVNNTLGILGLMGSDLFSGDTRGPATGGFNYYGGGRGGGAESF
jgi:hypothetical protein